MAHPERLSSLQKSPTEAAKLKLTPQERLQNLLAYQQQGSPVLLGFNDCLSNLGLRAERTKLQAGRPSDTKNLRLAEIDKGLAIVVGRVARFIPEVSGESTPFAKQYKDAYFATVELLRDYEYYVDNKISELHERRLAAIKQMIKHAPKP